MADEQTTVPLWVLHDVFNLLAKVEGVLDDEKSIQPYETLHDEIQNMVSNFGTYMLERKIYPNQRLVDAGFYRHLMTDLLDDNQ